MTRPYRVLFVGITSHVFLHALASNLKKKCDLQIDTAGLTIPAGIDPGPYEEVFDNIYDLKNVYRKRYNHQSFWSLGREFAFDYGVKGWTVVLPSLVRSKVSKIFQKQSLPHVVVPFRRATLVREKLENVDLIHLHFASPTWCHTLKYLPPDIKIVISIWGSDLYRITGIENYRLQSAAFERADMITLQSEDMREVLLAKFGQHLAPKVRLTLFGLDSQLLDKIDECQSLSASAQFRQKYNIAHDRLIICVGNKAKYHQQHAEILSNLSQLPEEYRNRFTVIMPMTYGGEDSYVEKIRDLATELSLDVRTITAFMSREEMALLHTSSDLLIFLPISDAFSAVMQEALYAGTILITGSWLPYSRLRTNKFYYHEVTSVSGIKSLLPHILDNYECEHHKALAYNKRIRNLFCFENTVGEWIDAYEAVLKSKENNHGPMSQNFQGAKLSYL